MLSKTPIDEVFMHYFEKMSSASEGFAPRPPPVSCPWTLLEEFRPSDPLIAHPWKKILRAPMTTKALKESKPERHSSFSSDRHRTCTVYIQIEPLWPACILVALVDASRTEATYLCLHQLVTVT